MSFTDLLSIVSVAEAGSFRQAAVRLAVSQPALSRRIQRLEDALGLSLFERHPSGARLTQGGSHFIMSARMVLRDMRRAIGAAQSHGLAECGRLRLGIIASLSRGVVRDLISTYLAAHPGVDVSMRETGRSELLALLSHREIDAVIAAGYPEPEVGEGLLLHHEAVYLAMRTDHRLAGREVLSWKDVRKEAFIVSAREPGPEIHDYITRCASDLGRSIRMRSFEADREGIMNLVGLGLGVSLVPDHWRGIRYPDVAFVRIGAEGDTIPFSITWRPENDNPALRRFVSLARVHARKAVSSPSAASQSPDPSP
ncbi:MULTISPECIES: LysR family transcriptional regulator [unclassified Roseitalea]|uniref:LysR family transcriptional regulator n=1 Tax=unclassified Roseitalea TaxID=2639107 RepID=UPI00273F3741|nr:MULTISPECIES: LysR family transcriptional regulator [unclassified Roseitalea]